MTFSTREFISRLGRRLVSEFDDAGQATTPGLIGASRETPARTNFQKLLPPMAAIGSGLVMDTFHDESRQQDIVVYERDLCPVFSVNETAEATYYPCEGTIAVGEVKSVLGTKEISDSFAKLASAKRLKRLAIPETDALGLPPAVSFRSYGQSNSFSACAEDQFDQDTKDLDQIFAFVLCGKFESSVKTTLDNCVEEWRALEKQFAPNFILSLNDGAIYPFIKTKNSICRSAMTADSYMFSPDFQQGFRTLVNFLNIYIRHGRTVNASVFRRYIDEGSGIAVGRVVTL